MPILIASKAKPNQAEIITTTTSMTNTGSATGFRDTQMEMLTPLALEVPIISARYARRFVRFMEHRGVKRHTILTETGITYEMLNNPDASLSMTQVLNLLRQADWLMTDERAAFEFGKQLDLPSHGLLGFAMLGQENPRRLGSSIVQYLRVARPLMDMELESTGPTFRIQ